MNTNAIRASIVLAVGVALRDCALLAAGVLLLAARLDERLDAAPDRTRAWLRCLLGGALLIAAGSLLAAHTGSVVFGWWPVDTRGMPSLALALTLVTAPVAALGGLAWREVSPRHLVAAVGAPATLLASMQWAPWLPCAFAASVALYVTAAGARHLGPMARGLAAPHHER